MNFKFNTIKSASDFIYNVLKLTTTNNHQSTISVSNELIVQVELFSDQFKSSIEEIYSRFKKIEQEASVVNTTALTTGSEFVINADGGSRGNPGPSASGFVIYQGEQLIYRGGEFLGITTNNQAEYQAVRLALIKAAELGIRSIRFRLDSLLVVNQMKGIFKVKNKDIWPIYQEIKTLIAKMDSVTFTHVLREYNKEADSVVNEILDSNS